MCKVVPICYTQHKYLLSKLFQVKNEGYDGREAGPDSHNEEPSQWNLPGSLLYSVTIITTIGELKSYKKASISWL